LDYYWSLLNHLENVDSNEKVRKIIETFRPKLQDFSNEVAYNKKYFEKLVYVDTMINKRLNQKISDDEKNFQNSDLEEQKRIMYLRIKAYKDR
jgi:Zn-dependent oligopeptidase